MRILAFICAVLAAVNFLQFTANGSLVDLAQMIIGVLLALTALRLAKL